ncbi:MAG TPA: sigma factor-like helix-turn-helix DNA-binding protein [Ktedonobacteraceae bacterium]|nr:sigma factor-like helix-turn-helix DNA-binding protein [Ktedonobacteraceae bacterium]
MESGPILNNVSDTLVQAERRSTVRYNGALPPCTLLIFQQLNEQTEVSLEALVRMFRAALAYGDEQGRDAVFSALLSRMQTGNEYWAATVLSNVCLAERQALLYDLCADLHEGIFRALMDPKRSFWEENFLYALQFERRHVYQAFMMREGCWHDRRVKRATRIPRSLVASLDRLAVPANGDVCRLEVEDEQAHRMLLAVETSDLGHQVMLLPPRLRAVLLLLFWEGCSEKEAAQLLSVTERTVCNRKRKALALLRSALNVEKNCFSL